MAGQIFHKVVSKSDPNILCDALCVLSGLSKVKIKDAMTKGAVWIQRNRGKKHRVRRAKAAIRPGDTLWLYFYPDILERRPPEPRCMLDRIDYSIWHKPAGLMSQGSPFGDHCSLPRLVETRFSPRRSVYPVHRLDREVSGLIIVAHKKNTAAHLSQMIRENRLEKQYKALVRGDLRSFAPKGEITLPLDNKPAVTVFDVISYDEDRHISTVKIEIRTGRLHQIRRHFDLIGHPVMGDPRYGVNNSNAEGLQLTANSLSFDCPLDGGRVEISIDRNRTKGGTMEHVTLNIPNISCSHCVATIENELKTLSGVLEVSGSPDTKQVDIRWDTPATLEIIKNALKDINYPAA